MALYGAMLAVTLVHIGLLFVYGNPEWKPLVTAYLGPAAVRRLLHLGRPVHLEPDEEPDRRRRGDLRRVPVAVGHRLDRQSLGPTGESILKYLSITDHFDDFVKGVIDTKHLIYYLSFIAFGLFLTAQVGRHRTVARIGGHGEANSQTSSAGSGRRWCSSRSAIRCSDAGVGAVRLLAAWAGLVCVLALHRWPVARDRARVQPAADALRHDRGVERRRSCSASWSPINYMARGRTSAGT